MPTHLSHFFRQRRLQRGVGFGELARHCGYKNISKGCNRIQRFEERSEIHPDLLQKLAIILGISDKEITRCIAEDKADWEQWANEHIEPFLIERVIAVFYAHESIPATLHCDRNAMEQFAAQIAKEKRHKVCLVLTRRLRVWFDRDGSIESETVDTFEKAYAPLMRLAGSRKTFLLNLIDAERSREESPNQQ